MSRANGNAQKTIAAVATMPVAHAEYAGAADPRSWNPAAISEFYRPIKKMVSLRLDADVLAWLKAQGRGYQTRVNKLLRAAMETQSRSRGA